MPTSLSSASSYWYFAHAPYLVHYVHSPETRQLLQECAGKVIQGGGLDMLELKIVAGPFDASRNFVSDMR